MFTHVSKLGSNRHVYGRTKAFCAHVSRSKLIVRRRIKCGGGRSTTLRVSEYGTSCVPGNVFPFFVSGKGTTFIDLEMFTDVSKVGGNIQVSGKTHAFLCTCIRLLTLCWEAHKVRLRAQHYFGCIRVWNFLGSCKSWYFFHFWKT